MGGGEGGQAELFQTCHYACICTRQALKEISASGCIPKKFFLKAATLQFPPILTTTSNPFTIKLSVLLIRCCVHVLVEKTGNFF